MLPFPMVFLPLEAVKMESAVWFWHLPGHLVKSSHTNKPFDGHRIKLFPEMKIKILYYGCYYWMGVKSGFNLINLHQLNTTAYEVKDIMNAVFRLKGNKLHNIYLKLKCFMVTLIFFFLFFWFPILWYYRNSI